MTNEELLENLMNGSLDESSQALLQSRRLEDSEFDADVSEFERVLELLDADDAAETASPALLASTKSKVVTAIATGTVGGALMSSGSTTFFSKAGLIIVGGLGAAATGAYMYFTSGSDEDVSPVKPVKQQTEQVIETPETVDLQPQIEESVISEQPQTEAPQPRESAVEESRPEGSSPQAEIVGDDTDPLLKATYAAEQQRLSNYLAVQNRGEALKTYSKLVELAEKMNKTVDAELWKQRKAKFEQASDTQP